VTEPGAHADEHFRGWMRHNLAEAAARFGLVLTGEPVFGWRLRSISTAAKARAGPCWLRVGSELSASVKDAEVGDFWTGVPDSNAIIGVPKPHILSSTEWDDLGGKRRVRADVMTVMPGRPCSTTDVLRTPLDLADNWWSELRHSIEAIGRTPTTRYASRVGCASGRVRQVFGDKVAAVLRPTAWETTHGDLHWSNVMGPDLGLLDWELWGPGPVGSDAATLYLFSLLVPDVATQVHSVFADVLDSPAGQIAQVGVASRILMRATEGEYADLAKLVRQHIAPIVDRA
jgi:hypothetical protein